MGKPTLKNKNVTIKNLPTKCTHNVMGDLDQFTDLGENGKGMTFSIQVPVYPEPVIVFDNGAHKEVNPGDNNLVLRNGIVIEYKR